MTISRVGPHAADDTAPTTLSKLARHVPGFVYAYRLFPDGHSCFPFATDGIVDIYGVVSADVLETAQPVFDVLHPDDLGRVSETIQASAASLSLWADEYRVVHPRKGIIWVHGESSPEALPDGSILWYGNLRDITELRLVAERQRVMADLASLVGDEHALLTHAISEIEGLTESRVGFINFVDADRNAVDLAVWTNNTRGCCTVEHPSHYPLHQAGIWADAFRTGAPVVVNCYDRDTRGERLPSGHAVLERFVAVPVFDGGRVAMILGVGNKCVDYDARDVETARLIGDYVWRSVRRIRAEADLRRGEAFLHTTGELARVGGWELDVPANELRWTAVTRQLYEVAPDYQPLVDSEIAFYHPDDRARLRRALGRALEQGESYELELRLITARGNRLWVKTKGDPVVEGGATVKIQGSIQDVTGRVEAEQALRERERSYREIFDASNDAIFVHDAESLRILDVNQAMLGMYGYADKQEVLRAELGVFSAGGSQAGQGASEGLFGRVIDDSPRVFEWHARRRNGECFWVEASLRQVRIGGVPSLLAVMRDIDQRRQVDERLRQAARVIESTAEGVLITDPAEAILAVNPAFTEITGYTEAEARGQTPRMLRSGRHDPSFYRDMWGAISTAGQWRGEIWNRRKSGELYPQLATISAVRDPDGTIVNYVAVFSDISESKRSAADLYRLAHEDALTGLPNRALLRARVDQSIQRARLRRTQLALLVLDLDLFKRVNDTLGHNEGDVLLQQVAAALAQRAGEAHSIARVGGDEFVVLMDDLANPNAAATLAQGLLDALAQPFHAAGRELYLTASIGISVYPMDGADMDSLLRSADVALYQAKDQGRNDYRFFEWRMGDGAVERLRLDSALRGALDRGELHLAYQPQIGLEDGCMHGVEALLRWRNGELGEVPPDRFIPIAEEIGLIWRIGAWVLEQACLQIRAWDAAGMLVPRVAVNLSVQQIERFELVALVEATLERTGVAADRLELEVTESMLMRDAERAIENLGALRALGITLAIDDFGSGYSSLRYLKRLPIDRLKIDKGFVDHLSIDAEDDAIARAVIALGRSLGLTVLAEGVETEAHAAFLRREGCQEAQGYHYGRPMSADALVCARRGRC